MSWNKNTTAREDSPQYAALIEEGAELEGTLSFSGTVLLNCRVRGEIISTGELLVGEKAALNATVRARIARIAGTVTGDVHASERVELHATARVYGDIEAPAVVVTEGAFFEGQCRMAPATAAEAEPPAAARGRDLSVMPLKRSEASR